MPANRLALNAALSRRREIKISVTGRQSGRLISIPVWFVLDDGELYLLPARGSDTQWYKNVLKNPWMRISAESAEAKYGNEGVKLYSKLDVAVLGQPHGS